MKTMTYLFNLTLLVVCTQFAFADNSENQVNKVFISPEEEIQNQADEALNAKLELMYPGKELPNSQEPQDSGPGNVRAHCVVSD